jgi:hypothetical protein
MSQATKNQFYRFSLRTTVAKVGWCTKRIMMRQIPPDNAQTLENLFCHVRINFDNASLPTSHKVLHRIGIISGFPAYNAAESEDRFRYIDVDIPADGSNIVDLKIDLTSLIDKTDINGNLVYLESARAGSTDVDFTYSAGTIELWKLDGIYTTREIR